MYARVRYRAIHPEGHRETSQGATKTSKLKRAGILEFRYSFDRPAKPQGWHRSLRNAKQQPQAIVHAAAVPEEEHRNEAPSAFLLARLQSQKSHTHAFARLSEPPGLTLGLEEAENVILTDCRFLMLASGVSRWGFRSRCRFVPGPLTLRMMERVVSSMNSTRTWVTPPREPECIR